MAAKIIALVAFPTEHVNVGKFLALDESGQLYLIDVGEDNGKPAFTKTPVVEEG